MADGEGCKCEAHGECECGCPNVDWTPKELVLARQRIAALEAVIVHMRSCRKPPAYCAVCNDLLAVAEMLDEQSKLLPDDSGEDPFGS